MTSHFFGVWTPLPPLRHISCYKKWSFFESKSKTKSIFFLRDKSETEIRIFFEAETN